MNKLIKTAILAAAGIGLVSTGAQAAQTPVELGFTESGHSDYIINLGSVTSLVGASSTVDLSSAFSASTFNSVFGSANGVSMAAVSGNPTFGQYDVYATQLRVGGAGDASVAGSNLSGQGHSQAQISTAAGTLTGNGAWPTTAGTGVVDSSLSYTSKVEAPTGSFFNKSGVQPASAIDNTGIIYEDLWYATPTTPYTYEGYFTFNDNTDSLTFTPVAVPEPTTYGLIAALGLLAVSLRSQFVRKNA